MSFIEENVIPGNYGKKFTTDAKDLNEFKKIKNALLKLDGVTEVIFESHSDPIIFIVHTDKVVKVDAIQAKVKLLNLHAVPTGLFFPLA